MILKCINDKDLLFKEIFLQVRIKYKPLFNNTVVYIYIYIR